MARKPEGKFLGLPFNWWSRRRGESATGLWDPDEPRLFPPKRYGWGYGLNLAALFKRRRRPRS